MPRKANGEGTISLLKDGRYQARIQVDGRRASVYGHTKSEAKKKLAALKVTMLRDGGLPENRTLEELFARWLESGDWKPRTRHDYEKQVAVLLNLIGPRTKLGKLTPEKITEALHKFKSTPDTARHMFATLRPALRLAVRFGWILSNPIDRVTPPAYRARRKDVLTPAQVRLLIQHSGRWAPLWLLLAATGLRIGEARALTFDDVDLEAGCVLIRRNVQPIAGKDVVSEPKTRSGFRSISLPPQAIEALHVWKINQTEELLRIGRRNEEGWVWLGADTGSLITYSCLMHAFRRDSNRAGLPSTATPHQLRHASASLLIAAGLPIPEVSRRLGHASPSITLSVYTHAVRPDTHAAEITALALSRSG